MDRVTYTIEDFCAAHGGISKSFFHKIVNEGKGPRLMKIGRRTLISTEAAADWRVQMEKEGYSGDEETTLCDTK